MMENDLKINSDAAKTSVFAKSESTIKTLMYL